jgi:hypothetical protein
MEPLKSTTKQSILETNPQAAPEDIEEYERLLAERFTREPSIPMSPEAANRAAQHEQRLAELYEKLFKPR